MVRLEATIPIHCAYFNQCAGCLEEAFFARNATAITKLLLVKQMPTLHVSKFRHPCLIVKKEDVDSEELLECSNLPQCKISAGTLEGRKQVHESFLPNMNNTKNRRIRNVCNNYSIKVLETKHLCQWIAPKTLIRRTKCFKRGHQKIPNLLP